MYCGELNSTGGYGLKLPLILSKDGIYKGDLSIDEEFVKDGKINFPVKIKEVFGDLKIYESDLTTLEGCPQLITGNFDIAFNFFTNLKGCPKEVGGNFECTNCNLKSLEGSPKKVYKSFSCQDNKLEDFKGCPKIIPENFICYNNDFKSLEGCPKYVGGNFFLYYSENSYSNIEKRFTEEDVRAVCDVKGKVIV